MDKQAIRDLFGKAWNAYASERKLAIREQLGQGYIADANVRLCDEMIAEQRTRLDALLAADDWHKWPEERPRGNWRYEVWTEETKLALPMCDIAHYWDGKWYCQDSMVYTGVKHKMICHGPEDGAIPWDDVAHWRPLPDPPDTKCGQ